MSPDVVYFQKKYDGFFEGVVKILATFRINTLQHFHVEFSATISR